MRERETLVEQADEIAGVVGDTFIDWSRMPPVRQWERIVHLLHAKGYRVVVSDD